MPADYSIPTANDILSYRGDPGLASGAGTGLSPIQVNPLGGVDSTLDKIQQINAQEAIMDYQQKAKDQEDLAKMLRETGGSVFNMKGAGGQNISYTPLPEDMKILNDKAHELRRMTLQHPDNYEFNEDWLDKKKEYDNLVNHAGVRAYAYSNYNTDAAKTNDPDERNHIMSMRESEIGNHPLTDFHMPEPHLPAMQIIDPISQKDWTDKKKMQQFGTNFVTRKDDQGNDVGLEVSRYGVPNSEILAPLNDVSTSGVEYIKNAFNGFTRLPQAQNPQYIAAMNADIDQKAQQRGIKPVYAATIGPDGRVQLNSPREVAAALNIEKHGAIQSEEKASDVALKAIKEKADIKKGQQEMAEKWASLKERIRHDKAEEEKGNKPTTEELKDNMYKRAAVGAYDDVQKVFDDAFKQPQVGKAFPGFWQRHGINPNEYNFYADVSQKKADNLIGIPAPTSTTTVKATEDAPGSSVKSRQVSETPDKVIPIENKATGEKKLVYVKNNEIISVVDEKNAIINKLKHEANYNPKEYENQTVWVDDFYKRGAPAQQQAAAPQQTAGRPANIPGTAELKQHPTLGNIYVDKKNRKIYDAATGAEIKIQ